MHITPTPYYRGALLALHFLERRRETGRRFGRDADARWEALRGSLTAADRINLLIRDADAQWPGAFGPRTVFNFDDVAARYQLTEFLQALLDCAKDPDAQAILLLVPTTDGGGIPRINGELVIPNVLQSQVLWVSRQWLRNKHNEAA